MKLSVSFCLFLMFSMVLVSSMSHAGIQLWDFEDAGKEKDWEEANGDWEFKKGIFQEVSAAESAMHQIVRGEDWEKWDDYTVSAKIRIDEGSWAGLIFRAQKDLHEYYVYYMNIPDNKTEFWVHMAGAWDTRRAVSSNIAAMKKLQKEKIEHGKWMDVKVVCKKDKFEFYINDELQGELEDDAYKQGSVGVWCWVAKASFDDVMVEGDSVTNTLAVDPQSKLAATWGNLKRSP
ncbi:TPA: DUF1080 domain-containing protein [Candidatus Poribacteria bacterium]|nr:DUF1080 domain-containing protein [Candidatus Poribacteria bacterium]